MDEPAARRFLASDDETITVAARPPLRHFERAATRHRTLVVGVNGIAAAAAVAIAVALLPTVTGGTDHTAEQPEPTSTKLDCPGNIVSTNYDYWTSNPGWDGA